RLLLTDVCGVFSRAGEREADEEIRRLRHAAGCTAQSPTVHRGAGLSRARRRGIFVGATPASRLTRSVNAFAAAPPATQASPLQKSAWRHSRGLGWTPSTASATRITSSSRLSNKSARRSRARRVA